MILDFVQHPDTGFNYVVPRNQVRLSFPDERRSGTIVVPGASGGHDPYGRGAFPRAIAQVTYRFRVTPRHDRETFDQARDAFVTNVGHGKRQFLGFITDSGDYRMAKGKLLRKPLEVDINAPYWADYEVAWEVKDTLLTAPNPPGVLTWGPGHKWGEPGLKWGATPYSYALTTTSNTILLDNATSGATADTTDMKLALAGPFGPATPQFSVAYIAVKCVETGTAFAFTETLGTGESAVIDFGGRQVLKNGQPIFGKLWRPPGQGVWLAFRGGVTNTLVISIIGTPRASLAGRLTLTWLPKYEP